jgi:hypothetical protein
MRANSLRLAPIRHLGTLVSLNLMRQVTLFRCAGRLGSFYRLTQVGLVFLALDTPARLVVVLLSLFTDCLQPVLRSLRKDATVESFPPSVTKQSGMSSSDFPSSLLYVVVLLFFPAV